MDPRSKLAGLAAAAAGALLWLTTGAAGAAPAPPERTLYTDAPNGMFLLDGEWSGRADPRDAGVRSGWQRPGATARFRPVSVPHAFNVRSLSRRGFNGSVYWYRAKFARPAAAGVTGWRIRFESVNVAATVWLNGRKLGSHRGAYLPFELRIGAKGLRQDDNELVLRVDSRGSASDLPPANRPRGWWNYGGILREVYLRAVRSIDVSDLHVRAEPGAPAEARITATVQNTTGAALPAPVSFTIHGPNGFERTAVADPGTLQPLQKRTVDARIVIPDARDWSPADPSLYDLTADAPGGQRTTAHFGVRRWSVGTGGRIEVNGRPITLRGASFHEQVAKRGAALTPADRDAIVHRLQALNANFARQHYPPHPALLEAFDRAGIVFWEQIPVWRVREAQLRSARFRRTALSALRQAVKRDRNHASVVAWSVSNETLRGGRGESAYFRAARNLVNSLDRTRLLAADKALRPLDDLPRHYRLLDAVGLNEYVGWYGGTTRELPGNLASVHRRLPKQALVVTELGAEANRSGAPSRKGTYGFQRRLLERHLGVVDRTPFLSGALVWVLQDFAVRPGWTGGNPRPRPPILFKGLFRRDGSAKPAVAAVRRLFEAAIPRQIRG